MRPVDPNDGERAFQRVLRMLSASEQSSAKVRRKLIHAGFDEEVVESALARARDAGILDDARYAEVLVRSTISQNKGFRPVAEELEELGIALEEVEAFQEQRRCASDDPARSDAARARTLLDAHPPRAKNLRDAAFRKLMSKGFDRDLAAETARAWALERAR